MGRCENDWHPSDSYIARGMSNSIFCYSTSKLLLVHTSTFARKRHLIQKEVSSVYSVRASGKRAGKPDNSIPVSLTWRLKTTGQHFNKICKKCRNCGISWPYLIPQWKIYSDKYKHAWYWLINSWNSCWNFREVRKQTDCCSVKPSPAF